MVGARAAAPGVLAIALLFAGPAGLADRLHAQEIGQGARAAELTDRFAERVAQALRLDDARSERLRTALQRSREMREELAAHRRSILRDLGEIARSDRVDQERIAQLLDELGRTQFREAEISADEQRRLSEFMAPLERARFLWLRQRFLQQARQRGQELRRENQLPQTRRPPPAAQQRSVPDGPTRRP